MKTNPRIYLSGPITGIEDYKEKFEQVETELGILGFGNVINPAHLDDVVLNGTYEEMMKTCMHLMDLANIVVMLPGWKKSIGCNREYGYALGKDMIVLDWSTRGKEWRV